MPRCTPLGLPHHDNQFRLAKFAELRKAVTTMLYLVALAWMYVVLMVAVAEVVSPQGSLLGAAFTVVGWGVVPLAIVLYILGTPARRRARRAADAAAASAADPDRRGHAPGDPVAPEREEA
jgi:membrane protein implicated in regulation of membrane protease activity